MSTGGQWIWTVSESRLGHHKLFADYQLRRWKVVLCGVPQSSVSALYCADVTNIAEHHGVTAHSYADDTQLYVHCKAQYGAAEARCLTACIEELDYWTASNRLELNSYKTQFIWVGSRQQLGNVTTVKIPLKDCSITTSLNVTSLGVHIDAELTFATHVKRVAARCFYQLRQLWSIRPALSADNARMFIHALITNRVDYCNSILCHVADVHLRPFQSVLNAAASGGASYRQGRTYALPFSSGPYLKPYLSARKPKKVKSSLKFSICLITWHLLVIYDSAQRTKTNLWDDVPLVSSCVYLC